jgi:hypothetical protein
MESRRVLATIACLTLGCSPGAAQGFGSISAAAMRNAGADRNRPAISVGVGGLTRFLGGELGVDFTVPSCDGCVSALSGSLLIGPQVGPARPYVAVGGALLRTEIGGLAPVSEGDLAASGGGGVMFFPKGRVGLRADLRLFRNLTRGSPAEWEPGLVAPATFWRLAGGVAFRWGDSGH